MPITYLGLWTLTSTAKHHRPIILLLQAVISLRFAVCLRQRSGENSIKIHNTNCSMSRTTYFFIFKQYIKLHWSKIQEVAGLNPSGIIDFFLKIKHFACMFFFFNLALIALLLGILSMHWIKTWVKLNTVNTRHLGTQVCWLLTHICFCSFFTAHWRHWSREKTGNICSTFLLNPNTSFQSPTVKTT